MKAKWFIRILFVGLVLVLLASLASQNAPVNAQATKAATMAATAAPTAPPPSKMRWDIITFSANAAGDSFSVDPGGVFSASANDGSTITYTGTGTFGPKPSDPVTGGGTWATCRSGSARPTSSPSTPRPAGR